MIDGVRYSGASRKGLQHDKKTHHLVAKRKKARDTKEDAERFAKLVMSFINE